jgi:hypothetical protein
MRTLRSGMWRFVCERADAMLDTIYECIHGARSGHVTKDKGQRFDDPLQEPATRVRSR